MLRRAWAAGLGGLLLAIPLAATPALAQGAGGGGAGGGGGGATGGSAGGAGGGATQGGQTGPSTNNPTPGQGTQQGTAPDNTNQPTPGQGTQGPNQRTPGQNPATDRYGDDDARRPDQRSTVDPRGRERGAESTDDPSRDGPRADLQDQRDEQRSIRERDAQRRQERMRRDRVRWNWGDDDWGDADAYWQSGRRDSRYPYGYYGQEGYDPYGRFYPYGPARDAFPDDGRRFPSGDRRFPAGDRRFNGDTGSPYGGPGDGFNDRYPYGGAYPTDDPQSYPYDDGVFRTDRGPAGDGIHFEGDRFRGRYVRDDDFGAFDRRYDWSIGDDAWEGWYMGNTAGPGDTDGLPGTRSPSTTNGVPGGR